TQGTFTGYARDTNTVALCASFTATVSAKGKISAKAVSADGTWTFSAPSWSGTTNDLFAAVMATKKGQTLTLVVDTTKAWDDIQMGGELNGRYDIDAQRSPFLDKKGADYAAAMSTLGTYAGYYTVGLGSTAVPEGWGAITNEPTGYGYLAATVDAKKGTAKLAGRLADGTAASCAAPLHLFSDAASIPHFIPLYAKRGYCSGWLDITNAVVDGDGSWLYPGKTSTGKNPATEDRFAMTLEVCGARYDATKGLALYDGLTFTANGAVATMSHDGKDGLTSDTPSVTLKANAKTGLFSGKANGDSHTGILVQRDGGFGAGYILVTEKWGGYTLKRSYPVRID
ncbi:MAG: hypothetical protein FWF84_06265, partial [Kiritimatiellaeota bacterium]|nr:hypothetical protein [Kiritimatiellota bacterium]